MKKGLKITGIVIAVILILLLVLPLAFKGKIETLVKTEGNKMLNGQFDFRSLNISLLRHFPQASLTLEDFWLKGEGDFATDTLVKAGELTATVNLFSLMGSNYEISRIYVEDTYLHAIVLEDGRANWDVMKTDSTATVEETTEESSPFAISLKKVKFDNVNLVYDDRQGKMYAELHDLQLTCSGDFASEHSAVELEAETDGVTFQMNGVPFLSNAEIATRMNVDADFANGKYTLKDNMFRLNAIETNLDGWLAMKGEAMDMDLKLNTNSVGFKELLSLIPAIYAKDFEKLKTDGSATLSAYAKGTLQGDTVPQFKADLTVENAMFRYPDLPAGVDKINIKASVENPGGNVDGTVVTVAPLEFNLAGNPFSLTAEVRTPISDPDFRFEANGKIDLGMIKQVYPLEDMQLNGVLQANMKAASKLSYIEKEQYDKVEASGTIGLSGMDLKMKDMPDVNIQRSLFTFTPQYLQLSETTVNIGQNDITADSKFENYMGYVLKGRTLKGTLNIRSNYMNLNDFMSADTTAVAETAAASDSTAAASEGSLLIIPKNIDFQMQTALNKVLFNKMEFSDVKGKLIVKNGEVNMQNLSLNTMGGNVVINGGYSTADVKKPAFDAGLKMTNLSFAQTYKELDMVRGMAPIFENLKGNFSGSMNIKTDLDQTMSPLLETAQGNGSLSTKDLVLSGVPAIDKIADAVNKPELKELKVKDLNLDFTIKDGRVETKPFDIKMGDYNLNLSGTTGLDQTIDYSGKVKLPSSAGSIASLTTFDLKIGGTFTSPTVKVDAKSMANQALQSVGEQVLDKLTNKSDTASGKKENVVNKVLNIFKKK
mgnify:CR=1 FL=1